MTGHWGLYLATRMAVAPEVVRTTTAAALHLQAGVKGTNRTDRRQELPGGGEHCAEGGGAGDVGGVDRLAALLAQLRGQELREHALVPYARLQG